MQLAWERPFCRAATGQPGWLHVPNALLQQKTSARGAGSFVYLIVETQSSRGSVLNNRLGVGGRLKQYFFVPTAPGDCGGGLPVLLTAVSSSLPRLLRQNSCLGTA